MREPITVEEVMGIFDSRTKVDKIEVTATCNKGHATTAEVNHEVRKDELQKATERRMTKLEADMLEQAMTSGCASCLEAGEWDPKGTEPSSFTIALKVLGA